MGLGAWKDSQPCLSALGRGALVKGGAGIGQSGSAYI